MWNTDKVLLNALRILQVTRLKLCQVFGSDRVDEEAQQEKNAPLRYPLKAHGHIPYARIQSTPGTRALRRRQPVRSHAFLLLHARYPSLEHCGIRRTGWGSRQRTALTPRRGVTLKSACAPRSLTNLNSCALLDLPEISEVKASMEHQRRCVAMRI